MTGAYTPPGQLQTTYGQKEIAQPALPLQDPDEPAPDLPSRADVYPSRPSPRYAPLEDHRQPQGFRVDRSFMAAARHNSDFCWFQGSRAARLSGFDTPRRRARMRECLRLSSPRRHRPASSPIPGTTLRGSQLARAATGPSFRPQRRLRQSRASRGSTPPTALLGQAGTARGSIYGRLSDLEALPGDLGGGPRSVTPWARRSWLCGLAGRGSRGQGRRRGYKPRGHDVCPVAAQMTPSCGLGRRRGDRRIRPTRFPLVGPRTDARAEILSGGPGAWSSTTSTPLGATERGAAGLNPELGGRGGKGRPSPPNGQRTVSASSAAAGAGGALRGGHRSPSSRIRRLPKTTERSGVGPGTLRPGGSASRKPSRNRVAQGAGAPRRGGEAGGRCAFLLTIGRARGTRNRLRAVTWSEVGPPGSWPSGQSPVRLQAPASDRLAAGLRADHLPGGGRPSPPWPSRRTSSMLQHPYWQADVPGAAPLPGRAGRVRSTAGAPWGRGAAGASPTHTSYRGGRPPRPGNFGWVLRIGHTAGAGGGWFLNFRGTRALPTPRAPSRPWPRRALVLQHQGEPRPTNSPWVREACSRASPASSSRWPASARASR